ncbi:MAG: hypothetical protein O6945_05045 [Gammaproteobacteria bacterium]|nr:hypothetical protein [Gammaproteobacteria bacterium]
MNDIPIGKYDVLTEANPLTGEIKQITRIAGKIQETIIQTKSDQIRNALIDLEWTPPEGKEHIPESKLPDGFRDHYMPKIAQTFYCDILIAEYPLHDLLSIVVSLAEKSHERGPPAKTDHAGLLTRE